MSFAEKEAQVDMVMALIDADRAMITHALQANNFNADTVVGEYYDSADKVSPPCPGAPTLLLHADL